MGSLPRAALWRAERRPTTPRALADDLTVLVAAATEALVVTHLPGWRVPGTFAGHPVGPDVRAELVHVLGLLDARGVDEVAATPTRAAITELLGAVDARRTTASASCRVAETLARRGAFAGNPLLAALGPEARDQVARACDSTDDPALALLDEGLPVDHVAVLARCETARRALGLPVDAAVADALVERTRALLARHPTGHLDGSTDGPGGRIEVSAVELHLVCEPLRAELGEVWTRGATGAADLVAEVATGDGAAVAWGRSTGAMALWRTVELAAAVLDHALVDDRAGWLGRAATASATVADRFADDGLIRAHQHRSPRRDQGPARRLQLTLDALGALAWAAERLAGVPDAGELAAAPWAEHLGRRRDRLVALAGGSTAGVGAVWALRSHDLACTLALVGEARADDLPAPQAPGLFEVPVDRPLAAWVPTVVAGRTTYAGGGRPEAVDHEPGVLRARWSALPALDAAVDPLPARRRTEWRAEGRTLVLDEQLVFDQAPEAISLLVPEAEGRPLAVHLDADAPHAATVVDTDGVAEWRSLWGPLPRVHQLDVDPATTVRLTARVTPLLRVATESGHHHYHRSLYGPLAGRVVEHRFAAHHLSDADGGRSRLDHVDLFHLHWPEWFTGNDLDAARRFLDLLAERRVRLVWTQHNLVPHLDDPAFEELYALVAAAADGVLHHSAWGRDRAQARYPYRLDCVHRVVPHGHWGNLTADLDDPARRAALRTEAEAELDLAPCQLRLGILGAPRRDKDAVGFAETFAATGRRDLGLVVLSLDEGEVVPDDPRITARPYAFVDRATYNRWLAAVDVLVLPFRPDGEMLTTGVAADAVAAGIPALTTSWPFLAEALGDAALPMGDHHDAQVAAVEGLGVERVDNAAGAARALQQDLAWETVAEQVLDALEAVGTARL